MKTISFVCALAASAMLFGQATAAPYHSAVRPADKYLTARSFTTSPPQHYAPDWAPNDLDATGRPRDPDTSNSANGS